MPAYDLCARAGRPPPEIVLVSGLRNSMTKLLRNHYAPNDYVGGHCGPRPPPPPPLPAAHTLTVRQQTTAVRHHQQQQQQQRPQRRRPLTQILCASSHDSSSSSWSSLLQLNCITNCRLVTHTRSRAAALCDAHGDAYGSWRIALISGLAAAAAAGPEFVEREGKWGPASEALAMTGTELSQCTPRSRRRESLHCIASARTGLAKQSSPDESPAGCGLYLRKLARGTPGVISLAAHLADMEASESCRARTLVSLAVTTSGAVFT